MRGLFDGRSVETTMGFTGDSGLAMATRSGDVLQGTLFYLLRRKLFNDASLEKMLYEHAALLALNNEKGKIIRCLGSQERHTYYSSEGYHEMNLKRLERRRLGCSVSE